MDLISTNQTAPWGARVTLPKEPPTMKMSLFCRDCRALLSANEAEGYVLLDLHDREQM